MWMLGVPIPIIILLALFNHAPWRYGREAHAGPEQGKVKEKWGKLTDCAPTFSDNSVQGDAFRRDTAYQMLPCSRIEYAA
jgi:hypothetical protein